METTSGRPRKRRASSGVQSTSTVTFMMRFLFAAPPAIGGEDSETEKSAPGKRFCARCWRSSGWFQSLNASAGAQHIRPRWHPSGVALVASAETAGSGDTQNSRRTMDRPAKCPLVSPIPVHKRTGSSPPMPAVPRLRDWLPLRLARTSWEQPPPCTARPLLIVGQLQPGHGYLGHAAADHPQLFRCGFREVDDTVAARHAVI